MFDSSFIPIVSRIVINKIRGKKVPLFVWFNITNKCNLNCIYCYNRRDSVYNEMTTQEVYSLIDELATCGTKKITFIGGEPLLRDDIGQLISYAKRKRLFTCLTTNGILIDEKIDKINKLDLLSISFCDEQKNSSSSKIPEFFDIVKKSLSYCKRVYISLVLTKSAVENLDSFLDKAKDCNVKIYVTPLIELKQSHEDLSFCIPERSLYRSTILRLLEEKKRSNTILNSNKYLHHILNWPDSIRPRKCWAGVFYCIIDSNGDLYPCLEMIDSKKATNFKAYGFKDAFKQLTIDGCKGCFWNCHTEFNELLSFNLPEIYNLITKL